ncbi:MAG TPA: hypothetical protein VMI11_01210 [Actinomycetes bacterium]|nr:hypothetical protein [Actinomycetes bacterium]
MRTSHALAPALVVVALATTACGSSSSGGGSSASSAASAAPSASQASVGAAGAAAFCRVFETAGNGLASAGTMSDAATKLRQFADQLQASAPAEIKDDVKTLADAYRTAAGQVGTAKAPSISADAQKAIGNIVIWTMKNCTGLAGASAPASTVPSGLPSSVPSSLPSGVASMIASARSS